MGEEVLIGAGCVALARMEIPGGKMALRALGEIVGDVSEEQKSARDWCTKLCQGLPARCKKSLRRL
jgi:hypothetical protein